MMFPVKMTDDRHKKGQRTQAFCAFLEYDVLSW